MTRCRSDRNRFELDGVVTLFTGKERGDLQMSAEGLHPFDGPGYVVSLLRLELQ